MMKIQKLGKGLFVPTGGLSDVVLNWFGKPTEKFYSYAEAYHLAAQRLFAKSSQADLRDVGACPVVFLYRHSLELYLKEIVINGQRILQNEEKPFRTVKEILDLGHDFAKLWDALLGLCMQIDLEWGPELDASGEIIKDFDRLDQNSFSFRYPVTKIGDATLKQDFRFDLRHFSEQMDELLLKLEAISCGIEGILDEIAMR